jgi:hypothetical protein
MKMVDNDGIEPPFPRQILGVITLYELSKMVQSEGVEPSRISRVRTECSSSVASTAYKIGVIYEFRDYTY